MRSYRFGEFTLDPQERRLLRGDAPVALTPKVFDTLVHLVERQGHLVRKEELMRAIWRDACVEDGNLPRTIHLLRRALGQDHGGTVYIETVPTKGYRFVAEVRILDTPWPTGNPKAPLKPVVPAQPLAAASPFVSVPALVPGSPPLVAMSSPSAQGSRSAPVRGVFVASVLLLLVTGGLWLIVRDDAAPAAAPGAGRPLTIHSAAYSNYEAGRWFLDRRHPGDAARALRNFETAVERDPRFAAAYAGLAEARMLRFWETNAHEDIAEARRALDASLERDAASAHAHALLCRIRAVYEWDFPGAETECRRAIALDPADDRAHSELALLLNSLGRRQEALREMDAAVALAPTSFNKRSRGLLLYFARRYPEAIAQFRQIEAMDPEFAEANRWMGRSFEQVGDHAQALEYLIRSRGDAAADEESLLREAFASGGWPAVLRASVSREDRGAVNLETAGTYALLGESDRAFAVLERMLEARKVMIVQIDSEPRLDPLRADPRYEDIARRIGLRRGAALSSPRSSPGPLQAAGRGPSLYALRSAPPVSRP